eukprot:12107-Heterococcus_DN1.PRE.3
MCACTLVLIHNAVLITLITVWRLYVAAATRCAAVRHHVQAGALLALRSLLCIPRQYCTDAVTTTTTAITNATLVYSCETLNL